LTVDTVVKYKYYIASAYKCIFKREILQRLCQKEQQWQKHFST